uniref:Uncharacterized protein n=1 Tax=viral metagenome TaxID=1070528 RepID=A0A6C0IGL5_9ZZZZ
MTFLDAYIYFIFFIKLIFIILAIVNLYLRKQLPIEEKGKEEEKDKGKIDKIKQQLETQEKIEYWKTRIELLFKFSMAFLLIYIFNPRKNRLNLINQEIKVLFFLFGIILVFTAKWKEIFKESKALIYIQSRLKL